MKCLGLWRVYVLLSSIDKPHVTLSVASPLYKGTRKEGIRCDHITIKRPKNELFVRYTI
jgi:hypothetical protein